MNTGRWFFFFNDTATTGIYTYWHTLSLHDALPICGEAEAWRKATQALRGERFLKTAAFITGHLNSMASDITRLLNRDLSEDLWRRYYKGERGLFTRKLIDQRDQIGRAHVWNSSH